MSLGTGQAALGQSVAGTSRAGVSLFPRVPRQGYQHDRGVPHERVPQDSGRTVNNAQNTTLHHMTRTRQTKGSTSSESSPFAPSATKMQETRYKMPATLEQRGGN